MFSYAVRSKMGKCVYCKCQLADDSVFDVCKSCGFMVWGEKMYSAIIQNMTKAKEAGDLYQGSISIESNPHASKAQSKLPTKQQNTALQSMAQEAVKLQEEIKQTPSMNLPAQELLEEPW